MLVASFAEVDNVNELRFGGLPFNQYPLGIIFIT